MTKKEIFQLQYVPFQMKSEAEIISN